MCTAVSYTARDHYFGRNLDIDRCYGESVAVTPRRYPLRFRMAKALPSHYAMIGMAHMAGGYPLYYEATNERGLSMAGLRFAVSAYYHSPMQGRDNIAPFELIPWVLGQCADLGEARALLGRLNVARIDFSSDMPAAPLHWLIADRSGCIALESVREGLMIHDDPAGVLTNEPPLPMQLLNLNNYARLSPQQPESGFAPGLPLVAYSNGMGALGMPGDLSSMSRFVRAAYTCAHSRCDGSEEGAVSQFFHILGAVEHPRGSVDMGGGNYEITVYSCCCNTDTGVYYYRTYDSARVLGVDMHREDMDGDAVAAYPMETRARFDMHN